MKVNSTMITAFAFSLFSLSQFIESHFFGLTLFRECSAVEFIEIEEKNYGSLQRFQSTSLRLEESNKKFASPVL